MKARKLCGSCFEKEFPTKKPSTVTWGAQCDGCKKKTESRATLFKVEVEGEV